MLRYRYIPDGRKRAPRSHSEEGPRRPASSCGTPSFNNQRNDHRNSHSSAANNNNTSVSHAPAFNHEHPNQQQQQQQQQQHNDDHLHSGSEFGGGLHGGGTGYCRMSSTPTFNNNNDEDSRVVASRRVLSASVLGLTDRQSSFDRTDNHASFERTVASSAGKHEYRIPSIRALVDEACALSCGSRSVSNDRDRGSLSHARTVSSTGFEQGHGRGFSSSGNLSAPCDNEGDNQNSPGRTRSVPSFDQEEIRSSFFKGLPGSAFKNVRRGIQPSIRASSVPSFHQVNGLVTGATTSAPLSPPPPPPPPRRVFPTSPTPQQQSSSPRFLPSSSSESSAPVTTRGVPAFNLKHHSPSPLPATPPPYNLQVQHHSPSPLPATPPPYNLQVQHHSPSPLPDTPPYNNLQPHSPTPLPATPSHYKLQHHSHTPLPATPPPYKLHHHSSSPLPATPPPYISHHSSSPLPATPPPYKLHHHSSSPLPATPPPYKSQHHSSSSPLHTPPPYLLPPPTAATATSSPKTPRRAMGAGVPATATSSPRMTRRGDAEGSGSGRLQSEGFFASAAVWDTLDTQRRHSAGASSTCSSEQGPESTTMYGHPTSSRRRKKRPMGHGIKNVQVSRGRSGYGFTISGQHPCVLSCIVGGSPADLAGLKAGDYLYFVNGVNVSHAPHDDVVRMVGQSTGTLDLQVAENYNSSDSSEDDYPPRSKSRYPNRVRFRQPQGAEGVVAASRGGGGGIASRPLPQRPVDVARSGHNAHSRYRNHVPVGADSDLSTSVTSPGSSMSEDRSRQERKRPVYERIGRVSGSSQSKLTDSSTTDMSGEGLAFSMATVQTGPVISTARISAAAAVSKRPPSRSGHGAVASGQPQGMASTGGSGVVYSQIKGTLATSGGAATVSSSSDAPPGNNSNSGGSNNASAEREEDEDLMPPPVGNEARALVGYIGSIELPGNVNRPNQRLQQLRSAVRRLRVEQKIHTLVLMQVDWSGVHLSNVLGGTVARYSVDKLAFSGVCPDDKRFFGIVTLHSLPDDVSEISGAALDGGSPSSSCHVFMVDPDMCSHVLHAHKAKAFDLVCTAGGPPTQRCCMEFPPSPTHLILCIANLYRDRPRTKLDVDIIQSNAFTDPSRPPPHRSSSNSSNSDSGLGGGGEPPPPPPGGGEQVCVVDMQGEGTYGYTGQAVGPRNCMTPSGSGGVPPSRSLGSLHQSPGALSLHNTPRGLQRPMSAFEVRRGLNNSSSSEECWMGQGRVDKLTPRAMPDPASGKRLLLRATSSEGLERGQHHASTENLRQSMQRLLQARQQQLQQEQAVSVSSDSESQVSSNVVVHQQQHGHHGNQDPFSARSAFQVPRPVSAPLKSRSRMQQVETVNMGFGKLSPRALQPPGSSVIRSPSAPPIPYFPHHDSDSDEDDTESEDDPFVRTIISQFNRDRVLDLGAPDNPRRYSEGYALGKQREKERTEAEELQKWTKTGSFRRSHNLKLKANVSQSHESLAVGEGEREGREGGHLSKLVGANSVNSIVTSAALTAQEEEAGRVAGWAVGFLRLLSDPIGITIFTEFLKKEISEENIVFWSAVESYRKIPDDETRRTRAQEIFSAHLGAHASDPVNVDSNARLLTQQYMDTPTPNMFDVAQQQIFQLMRTDSYSRFLKSDLYKGHLMREMEGHTILQPSSTAASKTVADMKKKGKGKENDEKRRRSLLPWRQNKKGSTKDSKGKVKEEKKEKEVNNNQKKGPGPGIDLSTMRKEVFNPRETEAAENTEPVKFCRVVMPDTSTTVVCARPGHNIRTVLGKLCDKRSLSIASVDVFMLGSDKPLDLEEDISTLGSKEVVIERRVLFRLDLPNHKSIGVKAKPNRSIRDVFKPILNKYGHRIDSCGVQLSGMPEFLDLDIPVSDLDNQRVIIVANTENAAAEDYSNVMQPPPPPLPQQQQQQQNAIPWRQRRTPLTFHLPSRSRSVGGTGGGKGGSLEEITNQIFEDLMKGKSQMAHTFDELGVVEFEGAERGGAKQHKNPDEHRSSGLFGLLRKESWGAKDTSKKTKGRVTFALPRTDSKKKKAAKAAEERLMEEITRSHCQQLAQEEAEERAKLTATTTKNNNNNLQDFVAADCVETVDLATAPLPSTAPPGSKRTSNPLEGGEGDESPLLPPPDMFDDVHYMHSGSPADDRRGDDNDDDTHLSDMGENEEVVDHVSPPVPSLSLPTPSRSVTKFRTFGTPRYNKSAAASQDSALVPTPNKGSLSARGIPSSHHHQPPNNTHLSMQLVIVDSRFSSRNEPHRLRSDSDSSRDSGSRTSDSSSRHPVSDPLHTLGHTVSPHFEGLQSFRPAAAKGLAPGVSSFSATAPKASPERLSPEREKTLSSPAEVESSYNPLRPIPARRKLLDAGGSASPRGSKLGVTGGAAGTGEAAALQGRLVSQRQPDPVTPRGNNPGSHVAANSSGHPESEGVGHPGSEGVGHPGSVMASPQASPSGVGMEGKRSPPSTVSSAASSRRDSGGGAAVNSRVSWAVASPSAGGVSPLEAGHKPSDSLTSGGPTRVSPKGLSSPTPNTTTLPSSVRYDNAPRYTPPPPYSSAMGQRQTLATKRSPTPTFSCGAPAPAVTAAVAVAAKPRSSPIISPPPYRHSASPVSRSPVPRNSVPRSPVLRSPVSRSSNPQGPSPPQESSSGFLSARDAPRYSSLQDYATSSAGSGSATAREPSSGLSQHQDRVRSPPPPPPPHQAVKDEAGSSRTTRDMVNSIRARESPNTTSPSQLGSRTPRESAVTVRTDLPTPRRRSNSHGSRHAPLPPPPPLPSSLPPGPPRIPRDISNHYGNGREALRDSQVYNRARELNSASQGRPSLNMGNGKVENIKSALSPRSNVPDLNSSAQVRPTLKGSNVENGPLPPRGNVPGYAISSPRNGPPVNGFVSHPSYSGVAGDKGFPYRSITNVHGPLSPRQAGPSPKGNVSQRLKDSNPNLVVADVHRSPDSAAAGFNEQTVTFV